VAARKLRDRWKGKFTLLIHTAASTSGLSHGRPRGALLWGACGRRQGARPLRPRLPLRFPPRIGPGRGLHARRLDAIAMFAMQHQARLASLRASSALGADWSDARTGKVQRSTAETSGWAARSEEAWTREVPAAPVFFLLQVCSQEEFAYARGPAGYRPMHAPKRRGGRPRC
jgi:hypothetical protein